MAINLNLENIEKNFPKEYTEEQIAEAKTIFLKELSLEAHKFYQGKIQVLPKAGIFGFNWFNVWYTPGVSKVSTSIRDHNETSFSLSSRANMVGVVSDSTRVLGDGNVTPSGGLGVMEGKAFLMKYLGGVDGFPLCIDSRDEKGENSAQKIIDFVKMIAPSLGAVNLEDISQPNCYEVLDRLQNEVDIPVWHDDAQGTACVTLAGLINALELVGKKLENTQFVFYGAGASNSTIIRLCIKKGANPENMIVFDSKGSLHRDRKDIEDNKKMYRQWEICRTTNPQKIVSKKEAFKNADVLIALSAPGPNTIKPEWIKVMAEKSIVFTCANPVPEIYPYAAKKAGAYIVATGRGDFANQVNNSLGFPGILKGALLVRATKITDNMAIAAAEAIAEFARERGISADNIIPNMDETEVFPKEAAEVAMQAIKDKVAQKVMSYVEVYEKAKKDIEETRKLVHFMIKEDFIKDVPQEIINKSLERAIEKTHGTL